MARVVDLEQREPAQPLPGVKRWIISGEGAMLAIVEARKGVEIPSHQHPEEQMTYVLEGKLEVALGDDGRNVTLNRGMVISYEPNVRHGVKVLEDTKVVELFQPPMESYLQEALK